MIGTVNTTESFQDTLRYVARDSSQRIFANFSAGVTDDVNEMARQMDMKAELSNRVQKPCYHISISPASDDELSTEEWVDFTQDFLNEMELDSRQAVGWLHHDEEFPDGSPRPHLHLVVNRVGGYGKAYSTSWDYRKVDSVLRNLEESYELESVTPASETDIRRDTPGQVRRFEKQQANYFNPNHPRSQHPESSKRSQIQDAIEEAITETASVEGIAAFLHRQGINTRFSEKGWSFEKDGIAFAGNQLGQRYSMNSVEELMVDNNVQQRRAQRSRTMKEIMQDSARSEQNSRNVTYQARDLQRKGKRLIQKTPEVDGLTLIGGAVATAGALTEIGNQFGQSLEKARTETNSERAVSQINQLEEIGDRTERLELSLFDRDSLQELEASAIDDDIDDTDIDAIDELDVDESTNPFEDSYDLANQRLEGIGKRLGVEFEDTEPIQLDPTASIGEQLDQMDQAIVQLDQRLSTLEGAAREASLTSQKPAAVAASLENFVNARTEFRGERVPSAFTSSVGTVELKQEGFQGRDSRLTITDPDFGTVFEAARESDGEWEMQINELTSDQKNTLTRLPQSAEEYGQYKQGQQMVAVFQSHSQTKSRFEGERGTFTWDSGSDSNAFAYQFSVERQEDGSQRVTGRDAIKDRDVFNATVKEDGTIFVDENDIPAKHTDKLLSTQQGQELKPPAPEPKRKVLQRSKQRELEL